MHTVSVIAGQVFKGGTAWMRQPIRLIHLGSHAIFLGFCCLDVVDPLEPQVDKETCGKCHKHAESEISPFTPHDRTLHFLVPILPQTHLALMPYFCPRH